MATFNIQNIDKSNILSYSIKQNLQNVNVICAINVDFILYISLQIGLKMKERSTPLGKEIKAERDKQGISLKKLSDMTGIDRGYLSQIELGNKTPGSRVLERIANALEIKRNVLLKHINLLKMDFIPPTPKDDYRKILSGLSPVEREKVLNYVNYLKYERETVVYSQSKKSI